MLGQYQDFEDAIAVFRNSEKKAPGSPWIPVVSEYLRMIINKVQETEFIMINLENSPK